MALSGHDIHEEAELPLACLVKKLTLVTNECYISLQQWQVHGHKLAGISF
jgi:hypothetical protein